MALELSINEISKGGQVCFSILLLDASFSPLSKYCSNLPSKVLFVVNRDTLACQASAAFEKAPTLAGRVAMFCGKSPPLAGPAAVIIATIQTLGRRFIISTPASPSYPEEWREDGVDLDDGGDQDITCALTAASLVIIDECHCALAPTYLALAKAYSSSKCPLPLPPQIVINKNNKKKN